MNRAVSFALAALFLGGCAAAEAKRPKSGYAEKFGGPVPGLSAAQLAQFKRGKSKFARLYTPQTGLGPLFNDNSCRVCHFEGASGGHSERTVTLAGAMLNGGPSLLEHVGGPMIQDRAVTGYDIERVPKEATSLSHRMSPPVWGMGLMEAVPEQALLAQMAPSDEKFALGIRGIANWEKGKIGRFGFKAQKATMKTFSEQAFSWELGISTPGRPEDPLPNKAPGQAKHPDISEEELLDVAFYQRYLGAPPRGPITREVEAGEKVFKGAGCVHCHTPTHTTGKNDIGIPEGLEVAVYSDMLLHVMDEDLADQMVQGASTGQMWRTTPLWGLRLRKKYLHDGRATDLDEAIQLHGGEATKVVQNYVALEEREKTSLRAFLNSL